MSVKDLFIQAPHLCGAAWPEKKAKIAELVWDHEMAGKGFGRVDGETALDRVSFLFDWLSQDQEKQNYCINLARLNVLAHYAKEHGDNEAAEEAETLKFVLLDVEPNYPDVSAVLTVERAYGGWWGE